MENDPFVYFAALTALNGCDDDKVLWSFYCAFLTFRWEEHILEMFTIKKKKKIRVPYIKHE